MLLLVASFIFFRGMVGNETVTRQYTPVSDVNTMSYFTLLIKVCVRINTSLTWIKQFSLKGKFTHILAHISS